MRRGALMAMRNGGLIAPRLGLMTHATAQQMVMKNLVERTYGPPRLELTAQGHEVLAALFNRG